MRFIPDHTLQIIPDAEFLQQMDTVSRLLSQYRTEGYFQGFDGQKLYYEYYLTENSTASVVVLHGMSEFTQKYNELIYYLINQGYNVFACDHRGHGFSCRMTQPLSLIHVDRFADYVADLEIFIDQIVLSADPKPLYLYGHSMGGAIAALYLEKNPGKAEKAVLSAPLMTPRIAEVPIWLAWLRAAFEKTVFGKDHRLSVFKDFDPTIPSHWTDDPKYARALYALQQRIQQPHYQSAPKTAGWLYEALMVGPRLLGRTCKRIRVPVLLLSAELDTVVKNKPQHRFAEKCPHCRLVTVPGGRHSMVNDCQQTLEFYMQQLLDFYSSPDAQEGSA